MTNENKKGLYSKEGVLDIFIRFGNSSNVGSEHFLKYDRNMYLSYVF